MLFARFICVTTRNYILIFLTTKTRTHKKNVPHNSARMCQGKFIEIEKNVKEAGRS